MWLTSQHIRHPCQLHVCHLHTLLVIFILRTIHTQVCLLSLPSRGLRGIFFFCLISWFKTVISGSRWFSENKSSDVSQVQGQLHVSLTSGVGNQESNTWAAEFCLSHPVSPLPPCFKAWSIRKYMVLESSRFQVSHELCRQFALLLRSKETNNFWGGEGQERKGHMCPLQTVEFECCFNFFMRRMRFLFLLSVLIIMVVISRQSLLCWSQGCYRADSNLEFLILLIGFPNAEITRVCHHTWLILLYNS